MILALILAAYTNHAGIAVSGTPVALTKTQVTLETGERKIRESLPLSVFPASEQRRIAADYAAATGDLAALRIPQDIRRALAANEQAIRRSEKRAAKKLCTEEESRAFIEKTRAARKAYLDKAVESGRLIRSERRVLD